jgi:hypothetical protein|nr:hypothetical protein [Marinilabilia salmonicolor]
MKNLKIAIVSFEAIADNLEENLRRKEEIASKATKKTCRHHFHSRNGYYGLLVKQQHQTARNKNPFSHNQ